MPMKIESTSRHDTSYQGSSTKITFLISCVGKGNETTYGPITINNLATVEFYFIQTFEQKFILQTQIEVKASSKLSKYCNVNVKVSSNEYRFFKEKSYSQEGHREVMGDNLFYFLEIEDTLIFQFSVTIHASKTETLNENLYKDDEFTDFRLSNDEGSIPVHKACIAAQSDVFKAMLNKEWTEAKEGRIEMKGVSLQTLQHLKDYMYLGTLPDDVLPLLSIASCYLIENLKADCVWKLCQNIKPDNFYEMLEYSMANDNPELTFAILKGTSNDIVTKAEQIHMEKLVKKETKEE